MKTDLFLYKNLACRCLKSMLWCSKSKEKRYQNQTAKKVWRLKLRLGVIVGVFTVAIGWTLNKFNVPALCVLMVLIVIFVLIVKKRWELYSWKVTSIAKLKISKFSSEISSSHTRLENFALYKPACSTAFACFEIDESYFGSKRVRGLVLSFTSFATDKTHSLWEKR